PVTLSPLGRGRARGTSIVLPSRYPRTPLRDITAIVRAIERTRARLGDGEGQIFENPRAPNESVLGSNISSVASLEHNLSTPASTVRLEPHPPPIQTVSKILINVANQEPEESAGELLTPQRKLLNSIDTVEKAVMEELQKMKRTPSAKKAQRQNKVRTLMSMR
ncbi:protein POLYCHOME-like, partial [Hibiscus syriacus]|uniref:protein POLYCHOME-like n=1 Tax=Hibiscus syriacus TaxID=106335 RepID=UPI0019246203